MLREEGGFDYKKAIVNTIISIVEDNPEAKEAGSIWHFLFGPTGESTRNVVLI